MKSSKEPLEYNLITKKVIHRKQSGTSPKPAYRTYSEEADNLLWQALRNKNFLGLRFIKKFVYSSFYADYFCHEKRIAIELYSSSEFEELAIGEFDEFKQKGGNISIIRIVDLDVIYNLDKVLDKIHQKISQ